MAYPLRTAGIAVTPDLADDLPAVEGDGDMFNQVELSLLVNARQALDGLTGTRQIALTTRAIGTVVVLQVDGSGRSVPADIRIFEPVFSTKPQGVGTGVGLSFCHGVFMGHQGRLGLIAPQQAQSGLMGAVF